MSFQVRELQTVTTGIPAMDGDGVKMTRIIGSPELNMLDPFLLLDAFETDEPTDYIGGFPDHPHRGFETVTYLLAGKMRHKDSAGHEGVIESGGVQWMTAGKGIVHSEIPEQENVLLQGFQLWVNLPASEKMQDPNYQEFPVNDIAIEKLANGTTTRVIAGTTDNGVTGPVKNEYVEPIYIDISLPEDQVFQQTVNKEDNTFLFIIDGDVSVGELNQTLTQKQMGVLSAGDKVMVKANKESRFLLVSARPLNEPVARGGPFVMNTKAEILQAFEDYKLNKF
ncbi:MAG: pirin family protein [Cycloclasticus sp.]